ncbi:MAG: hypothetical protein Q9224_005358, partial [Gallowayella concinna]
ASHYRARGLLTPESLGISSSTWLTMLPEAIATCYVRYKAYESAILSWVVSVSNACGFKKACKASDNVPNTRKAPEVAGKRKKYAIPREEILVRVEEIVNCKTPKVQMPPYIIDYLKKAIADREKCSAWFQEYHAGDTSVAVSTETHLNFTELLKTMLSMLRSIEKEPLDPPLSRDHTVSSAVEPSAKVMETKPRFSSLHVDELDTEEEESDASEGSSIAALEDMPEPSIQSEEIYEAETTSADRTLAMHEILGKLGSMRRKIETTWFKYREQRISLLNAYTVTNAALEMAQDLDDQFATDFPESPAWEDLRELMFPEVTAQWQKDGTGWSSEDIDKMDTIFQLPTAYLTIFRDVHEEWDTYDIWDYPRTWLPEVNDVYDPRQDVSKLTSLEKLKRSGILLDSMLPELALQVEFGVLPTHDKITAGFKELIETRQVRLWVAFSFQILCDIHLALGPDIFRPFEDLKLLVERVRRENEVYVKGTDNVVMTERAREELQDFISMNDFRITEDRMRSMRKRRFEIERGLEYVAENQKPFFLLSHHPVLSGSLATSISLRWHDTSTDFADVWRHVTAVLHLHSALKQEHCLSAPIPLLQELEDLYQLEKVFFGGRPTGARAYKNHYLLTLGYSIKWFAANKRKGTQPFNSNISKGKRPRDLMELRPLPQILWKLNPRISEPLAPLSELKKVVGEWYATTHYGYKPSKQPSPPQHRLNDIFPNPIKFLTALSDHITDEQPRLDFAYFRALDLCWRLLRRIEASPRIRKPFRKEYVHDDDDDDDNTSDPTTNHLHFLPLFIFNRNLDDPQGKWMQSVGETVSKFFRGELAKPHPPHPTTDDTELRETMNIKYAPGYKMAGDIFHPEEEENGKCHHIGVCELQIVHWRLQAGLNPWEDGEDEDGAWWRGLRADLTAEEEDVEVDVDVDEETGLDITAEENPGHYP